MPESTFITPDKLTGVQGPPVVETVYAKGPDGKVGVPLIVNDPPENELFTPIGNPETIAPVAVPPIEYTILEIGVFTQTV